MAFSYHNRVRLLCSGAEFFEALTKGIQEAKREIHFQSYILKLDPTGQSILTALKEAVERGVHVRLLLDAFGSAGFSPEKSIPPFEWRFFGPLFSKGRFHIGRRLHHKVVVIDKRVAIVGGINISDAYHGTTDQAPWLDFALWIEGEEAARIHKDCAMLWQGPRGRRLRKNKNDGPNVTENTAVAVRSVRNDFLRNRNEITATYRTAIRSAVKTIDLVGGYFLPGRRMRRYLKSATKRGVRIRIVAASRSDVLLARLSREYLYSWLLRNRIEVYEYLPANVHGKVLSVDGSLTSIGSYDLNNLSTYSNIEMNVNVLDRTVNEGFTEIYEETIRLHCRKVEETDWKRNTTLPGKFARWCAYRITKSLFGISFLIAGQSER